MSADIGARDVSEVDFIVVGAGTAGCAVASRLSEDPSVTVALFEAGPRDRSPLFRLPAGVAAVAADPRFAWGYRTEPQTAMGGRSHPLVQARVVGGGSSINGMVYTRGAARDYDAWRTCGVDGWDYAEVLPFFRKSQRSDRKDSPWHGTAGPVATTRALPCTAVAEDVLGAMRERGFAIVDDLNVPDPDGFARYDRWIARGRRTSSASGFGGMRGDRPNLAIRSGTRVIRILFERERAAGIMFERGGDVRVLRARREIILCAGAIGSAKLLLLSGVGPADALRALDIAPRFDHPHVGRNLANHVSCRLEYVYRSPTTARRFLSPWQGGLELARYLATGGGFLAEAASPLGGFFRSDPALDHPDAQLFLLPLLPGSTPGISAIRAEPHGFCLSVSQGVPHSLGQMWLRSSDPAAAPAIDPAMLCDPRDLRATADAVERMRDLAGAPALAGRIENERSPGPAIRRGAALDDWVRAAARPYFHPAGTCRMGRSVAESVTDSELRVHGLAGLRVADAGVMPRLVNGNLAAPVLMIAERAAAFARN